MINATIPGIGFDESAHITNLCKEEVQRHFLACLESGKIAILKIIYNI
jgi:hypothetical protein